MNENQGFWQQAKPYVLATVKYVATGIGFGLICFYSTKKGVEAANQDASTSTTGTDKVAQLKTSK